MSMLQAVKSAFSHYAVFQGRARRSEYWKFNIFNVLFSIVLGVLGVLLIEVSEEAALIPYLIAGIYNLAAILPGFALTCRRMHDVNKPGAYLLFGFLPVIGTILLIVWSIQDGDPYPNRYGPDPKGRNVMSGGAARTKRCPHCANVIDADAVYCPGCGKDTRVPAAPKAAPAAPKAAPTAPKAAPAAPKAAPAAPKPSYTAPSMSYSSSAAAPATKNCVNCGTKMGKSVSVCPGCGKDPDRKAASYSPAPAPAPSASRIKISKGLSAPDDLD